MTRVDLHPEDLLHKARAGLLSAAERERLDAHCAVCTACDFERQAVRELQSEMEPRAGDDALLAALTTRALREAPPQSNSPRAGRRTRSTRIAIWLAASIAAGTAAATVGYVLLTVPEPPAFAPSRAQRPSRPVAPAAQVPDAEPSPVADASVDSVEAVDQALARPRAVQPRRGRRARSVSVSGPAAAAAPPATAGQLFAEANQARRAGRYERAARLYRELGRTHGESAEAILTRVSLGRLLLDRLGDPRGALRAFGRYLAARPDGPLAREALAGRALALGALGRQAEEAEAWRELLRRFPQSVYSEQARQRLEASGAATK